MVALGVPVALNDIVIEGVVPPVDEPSMKVVLPAPTLVTVPRLLVAVVLIVTVVPVTAVDIRPEPVNVCVPEVVIAVPEPESAANVMLVTPDEATYPWSLTQAVDAALVESSATLAVPTTGIVVKVFAPPIVCVPVVLTTVESTATELAFTVIPVPEPTVNVTLPDVPPPVKPLPAVTPVMSPVPSNEIQAVPL